MRTRVDITPTHEALLLLCNHAGVQHTDFVAYSDPDHLASLQASLAFREAVRAGMWVGRSPVMLWRNDSTLLEPALLPGDSLGRDAASSDTDRADDWAALGGADATGPTPGVANIDPWVVAFRNPPPDRLRREVDNSSIARRAPKPPQPQKPPQKPEPAKWAVLSFLDTRDDKKFFDYFVRFLREVALLGTSPKIHFVAQYGNSRKTARRLHLEPSIVKFVNPFDVGVPIPDKEEFVGSERGAISAFISWAVANYPAENYVLHFMGHGQGWKGTALWDGKQLTMRELSSELGALGKPFEAVYMESCLMGAVEVAYQLRSVANYAVLSEEVVWANAGGAPWKDMRGLAGNPKTDGKAMGSAIARSYGKIMAKIHQDWTMAVVDLGELGGLMTALSAFADALRADMEVVNREKRPGDNLNVVLATDIRPKIHAFSDRNFLDIGHLALMVKNFARRGFSAGEEPIPRTLQAALDKVVALFLKGSKHGPAKGLHVYFPPVLQRGGAPNDLPYNMPTPAAHLYSRDANIRIPQAAAHEQADDSGRGGFAFPGASSWDEFLRRFYKPTAEAVIELNPAGTKLGKRARVKLGDKVTLSGVGSSDGDVPPTVGIPAISAYWWDFDAARDAAADLPNYPRGPLVPCTEDCDRDGNDQADDDADAEGVSVEYECEDAGRHTVTLAVWDTHHTLGSHDIHFQVDQDTVEVECVRPPAKKVDKESAMVKDKLTYQIQLTALPPLDRDGGWDPATQTVAVAVEDEVPSELALVEGSLVVTGLDGVAQVRAVMDVAMKTVSVSAPAVPVGREIEVTFEVVIERCSGPVGSGEGDDSASTGTASSGASGSGSGGGDSTMIVNEAEVTDGSGTVHTLKAEVVCKEQEELGDGETIGGREEWDSAP